MIQSTRLLTLLASTACAILLTSAPAHGQQRQVSKEPPVAATDSLKHPFTEARFAALQRAGALVLLDVYAPWCPTCARQQTVIASYRAKHPEVALHTLVIDFDTQKKYVQQFKAPRQSTLILYRGTERVWFGVAETRPEVIFAELNKAAGAEAR